MLRGRNDQLEERLDESDDMRQKSAPSSKACHGRDLFLYYYGKLLCHSLRLFAYRRVCASLLVIL